MTDKKIRNLIIASIIGIIISTALVLIQAAFVKKGVESNFVSINNKLGPGAAQHGVNIYISDRTDVPEGDLVKREGAKKLNGGPFENGYKQMQCYLTKLVSGMNVSKINSLSGRTAAMDGFGYYDENQESIMMVNTLMLVMKDADDTNAEVFYTYQDPVFSEIMQGLLDKYGSDIGEVVFEINGAYIKGDEFIPKKIDYCRIDRNGSIYDKNSIQTGAKDIDDMKADGYEYFGIEDRFLIGDISDNGNFVTYCYDIPAAQKNRMQEMLKDVVSNGQFNETIKGKNGIFTVEYLRVNKIDVQELGKSIYSVSYKYDNTLYEIVSYKFGGGRGLLYIELYFVEISAIMITAVVTVLIINRIKYKKRKEE